MIGGRRDIGFSNDLTAFLKSILPGGRIVGSEYVVLNPRRPDSSPGSFSINIRTGAWADFAIDKKGGDVVSLYGYLKSVTYREAINELSNGLRNISRPHSLTYNAAKVAKTAKEKQADLDRAAYLRQLWKKTTASPGTLTQLYLQCRGIKDCFPEDIRFLKSLKHYPSNKWPPCMVTAIRRWPDNDIIALHRTWLAGDGHAKADVSPAKMALGSYSGGAVQLTAPGETLVIGEGIETSLSVHVATGLPTWAAISSGNLPQIVLPELPLARDIIIAADNDAAGIKAAEAAQKWLKEGRRVRIAYPPLNQDFNDLLLETTK